MILISITCRIHTSETLLLCTCGMCCSDSCATWQMIGGCSLILPQSNAEEHPTLFIEVLLSLGDANHPLQSAQCRAPTESHFNIVLYYRSPACIIALSNWFITQVVILMVIFSPQYLDYLSYLSLLVLHLQHTTHFRFIYLPTFWLSSLN